MSLLDGLSPDALSAWQAVQQKWGRPLNINSGYRSPEHNERVGGAKHSQHTHGNALDIDVSGMSQEERLRLAEMARGAGFQGFGFYDNALHFDVGPERAWGADYSNSSLPGYARDWFEGGNAMASIVPESPAPRGQVAEEREGEKWQYTTNALDPRAFMSQRRPLNLVEFT